jgi:hypothetical protein
MNRLLRFTKVGLVLSLVSILTRPSFAQEARSQAAEIIATNLTRSDLQYNPVSLQAAPDDVNWDTRFDALGIGPGAVLAVAVSGSDVYVGGVFGAAGGVTATNIAKWDGSGWSALESGGSNGTNGFVQAIAVDGNDVFVGGNFSQAGGVSVNNIAKWDGSNWTALGSGIEGGDVKAINVLESNVFVSGFFTTAGGVAANNIAKWDGSSWSTLGAGVNGPANALASKGNELYVGGPFTTAGGQSAENVAKWSLSEATWDSLGAGVNGAVNALAVASNDLYAAGIFTTAGGGNAKKVAKWDGTNWSPLGEGITGGDVNAVAVLGSKLFVAGTFSTAGGLTASQIASWDGSVWSALGSGITGGPVFGLSANLAFGAIYAGGAFGTAGANTSKLFAKWTDPSGAVPVELTSFSAQVGDNRVELSWSTATELNNFGFELERSIPSRENQWEQVAFVRGQGTTAQPHQYSYVDNVESLIASRTLTLKYRLKQIDLDGTFEYFQAMEVKLSELPNKIILAQNYPNPFNPETTIEFVLPEEGFTTLKVYNLMGQEVQTLVSESLTAGVHRVNFNAGSSPTGAYFYVVQSGENANFVRKTMLLVK